MSTEVTKPAEARKHYPTLAEAARNAQLFCWTEAAQALDEIDRLRGEVDALLAAGCRLRRAHSHTEGFVNRCGETLLDVGAGPAWDEAQRLADLRSQNR